jgi:SRSO17 transposase
VKAKIPEQVELKTKPELGVGLVEQAAGWRIPAAPVLGDQAYGDNTALRQWLHDAGREYVLAVGALTKVFAPETVFAAPEPSGARARPKSRPLADSEPETISELIARVGEENAHTVTFRDPVSLTLSRLGFSPGKEWRCRTRERRIRRSSVGRRCGLWSRAGGRWRGLRVSLVSRSRRCGVGCGRRSRRRCA